MGTILWELVYNQCLVIDMNMIQKVRKAGKRFPLFVNDTGWRECGISVSIDYHGKCF